MPFLYISGGQILSSFQQPQNKTSLAIVRGSDFDLNNLDHVKLIKPWYNASALSNPGTLPVGASNRVAWSPNGEYLAVAHEGTPYITIYQRSGTTFTKLADPAVLPVAGVNGIAFSPDGTNLALATTDSSYKGALFVYVFSGSQATIKTQTQYPAAFSQSVAWSPNGEFLAVALSLTPFVNIYQTSGSIPTIATVLTIDPGDS